LVGVGRLLLATCTIACGDTPGDAEAPSEACLAQASNAFRTRFIGAGFASFEGIGVTAVTTITTIGGVACRAAGATTIADGAFVTRADNRRDDAVYPRLGAFIDVDHDGACNAEIDLAWTRLSIAPSPEVEDTIELTAEHFSRLPDGEGCALLRAD